MEIGLMKIPIVVCQDHLNYPWTAWSTVFYKQLWNPLWPTTW